jgi:dipeptidyl aminopeptidase/acylaminoacyl peptidase
MSQYNITVSNNNIEITTEPREHSISLSRTGGQGTQGNSISNAAVNASNELIITIVDSGNNVVNTINAGVIDTDGSAIALDTLLDVDATAPADGDALHYETTTSRWTTRKTSTDDISDIDNAGKTEGAVLLYDASTSKYKSTRFLNSNGTQIIGGTF